MRAIGSEPARRLRWTIRLRLTLLYGSLFLVSGVVLLGITYALAASTRLEVLLSVSKSLGPATDPGALGGLAQRQAELEHAAELRQLLIDSGVALAVMVTASVALGWFMAGRVLRPLRVMTDKARRISEHNLHERLAISGPDDELKDLGDTFDGLLSRLQAAFRSQKRFVASASHELRTPLTLQRAMIEVALSDPDANTESLREICGRVVASGENQERLIEALLTLASSERGLDRREPVELAGLVGGVLRERPDNGTTVQSDLRPAWTSGATRLVERLASNLVDNALRHNVTGGWMRVVTGTDGGAPVLKVANSGPVLSRAEVALLFQPFQRLESRSADREGHGLGLSIVTAIATAHNAALKVRPVPSGGLEIEVRFPPPAPAAGLSGCAGAVSEPGSSS